MALFTQRRRPLGALCRCAFAEQRRHQLWLLQLLTKMMLICTVRANYRQLEYDFVEEQPVGTVVGTIPDDIRRLFPAEAPFYSSQTRQQQQQQQQQSQLYQLRYTVRSPNHYFQVDELTGQITCVRVVDRELICPPYSSAADTGCDRIIIDVTIRPQSASIGTSGTASDAAAIVALGPSFSTVLQQQQQLQLINIIITIVDINDHSPVFSQDWEVVELIETTAVGTTFAVPEAEDADSEPLSVQSYRMQSADNLERTGDDAADFFELVTSRQIDGSHEVRIRLMRPLDRETRDFYSLQLVAIDGGTPARSASVHIDVFVRDANDNSPTFDSPIYEVRIDENLPAGTSVARVHAVDSDSGPNGVVRYSLASTSSEGGSSKGGAGMAGLGGFASDTPPFVVNETTGVVYVDGQVDYEYRRVHELTIIATDSGPDPLPSFTRLTVYVADVNDNPPNIVVNTLSQQHHHHHHHLDHQHQLQQQHSRDRHRQQQQQQQSLQQQGVTTDYATVVENAPRGTFVCHVAVTDPDTGSNARVDCTVLHADRGAQLFNLEPIFYDDLTSPSLSLSKASAASQRISMEYKLVTAAVLDREALANHHVTIECRDFGYPTLVSSRSIDVRVDDENDNSPELPLDVFFVSIIENNQLGSVVSVINGTDKDEGPNGRLIYRLEPLDITASGVKALVSGGSALTIDPDNGTITAARRFDYEAKQTYTFLLTVSDQGELVQRSAEATVVLDILDQNDELPRFDRSFYSFHVTENRPPGTLVGRVRAVDDDRSPEFSRIFYFIDDRGAGGGVFRVSSLTGELFTRSTLDRETASVWRLKVRASNDPSLSARSTFAAADVHIHVDDVNDNEPIVVEPPPGGPNVTVVHIYDRVLPAGHVVAQVRATDADEGANGRLTFSLSTTPGTVSGSSHVRQVQSTASSVDNRSSLFTVDETTGDVKTARTIDGNLDAGSYQVTVVVRDNGIPKRLSTVVHFLIVFNSSTTFMSPGSRPQTKVRYAVDFTRESNYGISNIIGEDDLQSSGDANFFDHEISATAIETGVATIALGIVGGLIVLLVAAVLFAVVCGRHRRAPMSNGRHIVHASQTGTAADLHKQLEGYRTNEGSHMTTAAMLTMANGLVAVNGSDCGTTSGSGRVRGKFWSDGSKTKVRGGTIKSCLSRKCATLAVNNGVQSTTVTSIADTGSVDVSGSPFDPLAGHSRHWYQTDLPPPPSRFASTGSNFANTSSAMTSPTMSTTNGVATASVSGQMCSRVYPSRTEVAWRHPRPMFTVDTRNTDGFLRPSTSGTCNPPTRL